ncbi:hypothetical protein BUALT_Bualt15G0026100 [Buddleja alternifolia]|uniref:Sesquiterpene synthase n=1 Tax=Buddleja alternifolia TaxID=168488 RepID=A0AAV6WDH2_9LAMI|nr:hypothetical protein BUALT_Bualt15G0026100 [Buddleja alternifolia]
MESRPPSAARSPISAKDVHFENVRRSVTYHPSVWDDYFLVHASNFTVILLLLLSHVLNYFVIYSIGMTLITHNAMAKKTMIFIWLLFTSVYSGNKVIIISRLIRIANLKSDLLQCGLSFCNENCHSFFYMVTYFLFPLADVFNKLIDHERKFKTSLINNVQGILSLYEATNMGIQGEETLDEALEFSSSHLKSMNQIHMSKSLATQINEALKTPIRKTYVSLGAKRFLTIFQDDDSHNEELLKFPKLDFNYAQKIHQKELIDVTRWWKTLDFKNKLPFVRDRVVENFFWAVSDYFESQYHLSRIFLTKVITVITVIDDIYDVYGSINDLELFTNAIERWHNSFLKIFYLLVSTFLIFIYW